METFSEAATLSKIPLNTKADMESTKFIRVKTIKVRLAFFNLYAPSSLSASVDEIG